jgi:hypothetical protein
MIQAAEQVLQDGDCIFGAAVGTQLLASAAFWSRCR